MSRVLLLGCGSKWDRRVEHGDHTLERQWEGQTLVTLDAVESHHPDLVWDLNITPWPVENEQFEEVHAYEVLEHLGRQGDAGAFFDQFYEIWRTLKPYGVLCGTVPWHRSEWAWGDPSHTRVITPGTFVFLSQEEYKRQVGVTAMSDFRHMWKGDFQLVWIQKVGESIAFKLLRLPWNAQEQEEPR